MGEEWCGEDVACCGFIDSGDAASGDACALLHGGCWWLCGDDTRYVQYGEGCLRYVEKLMFVVCECLFVFLEMISSLLGALRNIYTRRERFQRAGDTAIMITDSTLVAISRTFSFAK